MPQLAAYHRLDGEHVAFAHNAHAFVVRVVRNVGRAVEQRTCVSRTYGANAQSMRIKTNQLTKSNTNVPMPCPQYDFTTLNLFFLAMRDIGLPMSRYITPGFTICTRKMVFCSKKNILNKRHVERI